MDAFDPGPSPIKKARIEIIPLIDVIFFLLATFVLFTLSLQKLKTIDVELPVTPGKESEPDTTVFIQASADGMFYWKQGRDGAAELISAVEIRPRLENYKRSVPVPRVFIRSDRTAKFAAGVFALDEVRRAGIKQVSVETMTSETGR
jgi:biopolymer transport protein ExbD